MSEETPTLPTPHSDTGGELENAPPDSSLHDRLAKALGEDYELGPQIGRGGMGIVFRATDRRLRREVAIKVLPPEITYRADMRKRFVREAQVAASLTHPNIVPVYDVGNAGGLVWFVMALIHGETVRDLVRRSGPQPVHSALRVLRETAWAISYAHARGIVHRDIKPDNIMIDRGSGRTIVTDFGLAKVRSEEGTVLTSVGGVVGTPAYMSPEQARGAESIDHRTDIYSLGLVGYYLLTGRNPFGGAKGQQAVLARVLTEPAPDPSMLRPDLPSWLVDALRRATQRERARRFEKAEELANDLDQGDAPAEVPTSVDNLLDLLAAYGNLSLLAAWILALAGIPAMPAGAFLILVLLLALPLMRSLHLMNAEGIAWEDIRGAIQVRRMRWLRSVSLRRQAGFNIFPPLLVAITFAGLLLVFALQSFNLYSVYKAPPLPGGSWEQNTKITVIGYDEATDTYDFGALDFRTRFLNFELGWAFWYAVLGSLVWARVFGLPTFRKMSPAQLDAVTSWRLPKALDLLGAFLFSHVKTPGPKIEVTSDFRQLSDPAIQSVLAFNRTRRALSWSVRLRMRRASGYGSLLVKRLWGSHETLQALRKRVLKVEAGTNESKAERLSLQIEKRENLVSECSAALDELRLLLEEGSDPYGEDAPEPPAADQRALEEARRLTRPMRIIRRSSMIYLLIIAAWLGLNLPPLTVLGFPIDVQLDARMGAAGRMIDDFLGVSFIIFIIFQFFKSRLYT